MHLSKTHTRDIYLDAIKGMAVILMVLSHSENLFNNNKSPFLHSFDIIGNTLAFTLFVFASGMSAYYAYYSKEYSFVELLNKMLKRGIFIYIAYVLFNILASLISSKGFQVDIFIDSLLFIQPGIYSEFLIPLIFFPYLLFILRGYLRIIYNNVFVFVAFLVITYLLGSYFSTLNYIDQVKPLMNLIVGESNIYRYPFIQYSVIYLLGLRFAGFIANTDSKARLIRIIGQLVLICSLLLLGVIFLNYGIKLNLGLFLRWPPGLGFVLIGILFALGMYYLMRITSERQIWINLSVVGRISFAVLIIHVLVMYGYKALLNYQFENIVFAGLSMICFIVISILFPKALMGIIDEIRQKKNVNLSIINLSIVFSVIFIWLIVGMIYAEAKTIKKFDEGSVQGLYTTDNSEKIPNLETYLSRKWIIKNSRLPKNYTNGTLGVSLDYPLKTGRELEMVIIGEKETTTLPVEKIDKYNYFVNIDSIDWAPGEYLFKAKIKDYEIESAEKIFIISYPLYVTWSFNYEGYDVSDKNLASMNDLINKYKFPVTHMFNPRVLIAAEIEDIRKNYLANWILERNKKYGEEIGLHMHMNYDVVSAVGLTPISEPAWGNKENGQNVLTSAYDYYDFTAMLLWAKDKFKEYGLPRPYTYRAASYFIGNDQLLALQDQGFSVDASGRNKVKIGTQVIPWTLSEITRPYHPSAVDQNAKVPNPILTLWEFPNNGFDSTNYDEEVLKKSFDLNYSGKPLVTAQTLSYVSRPDWFINNDEKRMKSVLTYINSNKADEDTGPVFYFTIQDALKYWD